jgi:hypothetical protein
LYIAAAFDQGFVLRRLQTLGGGCGLFYLHAISWRKLQKEATEVIALREQGPQDVRHFQ